MDSEIKKYTQLHVHLVYALSEDSKVKTRKKYGIIKYGMKA